MGSKDSPNMITVRNLTKRAIDVALNEGLAALEGQLLIAFSAPMLRKDKGNEHLQDVFEEALRNVKLPPGLDIQINYLSRIEPPWWMFGKARAVLVRVSVLLVDYSAPLD